MYNLYIEEKKNKILREKQLSAQKENNMKLQRKSKCSYKIIPRGIT